MNEDSTNLAGMTVNERLCFCGLMDDFDRACDQRDLEALRLIFARIELPDYPVEDLLSYCGARKPPKDAPSVCSAWASRCATF